MDKLFQVLGSNKNFFLVSGPCVIESLEHCLYMCEQIKYICDKLGIQYIFKASFDKANRTSVNGFRGPGLTEGLEILKEVKEKFGVPICTDVHESWQCKILAEVVDIIQIPAFLCRQTDLLIAAGETDKIISVKKGQFCNDITMKHAYEKILSTGNHKVILTDRGTMLGYDDLVVDFRNLVKMRENKGALIMQDATHALQQPNRGNFTHGVRYLIPTIARAAVAVGLDGLFMEVHNNPEKALSDATTQYPLDKLEELLVELLEINKVTKGKEVLHI